MTKTDWTMMILFLIAIGILCYVVGICWWPEKEAAKVYPAVDPNFVVQFNSATAFDLKVASDDIEIALSEPNMRITIVSEGAAILRFPIDPNHDDHCGRNLYRRNIYRGSISCGTPAKETAAIDCNDGTLEITGDLNILINAIYDHIQGYPYGVHRKPVVLKNSEPRMDTNFHK